MQIKLKNKLLRVFKVSYWSTCTCKQLLTKMSPRLTVIPGFVTL